jgi:RNA polymerase sigma-70 factor (ECF subfamily)
MNAPLHLEDPTPGHDPEQAVAALFDAYCPFVCRSLRRLGVDDNDLDDAVQDVFVTAYRRWHAFEGRASPRTWLFGIARRVAFRSRRSARRDRDRHGPTPDQRPTADADPYARHDASRSLGALLRGLDRDKRAVFVLSELEGMTAPEVAEALQIPLGTAYSRLRAAWKRLGHEAEHERQRLRSQLQRAEPEPVSPARQQQMWGLVVASVATEPLALPLAASWLAPAKWLLLAGAIAGVAVVGIDQAGAPRDVPLRPDRATVVPEPAPAPADIAAALARPARPVDDLSPGAGDSATAPVASSPTDTPPPPPTHAPPSNARQPATESRPDALREEVQLLRDAQAALRRQDAATALATLDDHARRFPRGQLAAERETTRIRALCAAKKPEDAAAVARAQGLPSTDVCTR